MNKNQVILRFSLSLAIMLTVVVLFAQPSGGGGGVGSGGTPPATGAPIDGGAGILLAGIAAYAHRMLSSSNHIK